MTRRRQRIPAIPYRAEVCCQCAALAHYQGPMSRHGVCVECGCCTVEHRRSVEIVQWHQVSSVVAEGFGGDA